MLLNDAPRHLEREAGQHGQAVAPAAPEPGERREALSVPSWLVPWLLAFAGILITLALTR